MTSKMLHHLMNTNFQNKLYYGSSDRCPCCNRAAESFSHVLSCCDPSAATNCDSAFTQLMTALSNIKTPLLIIEAIKHGTKHWLDPGSIRVRALTAGSLHPGDTLLTTAFQEQFHNIGWYHLFLGRLSSKWESAYIAYTGSNNQKSAQYWSSLMVSLLWKYSLSLWGYRNAVVHGSNYEESTFKRLQEIQSKVSAAYDTFSSDPNPFLPRHHYLFNTPLRTRLRSSYDNMQCFLHSVMEAQHVLQHQQAILRREAS